jgi:hypothetical protein
MPPVRRQDISADGFEIASSGLGLYQAAIVRAGNRTTVTMRKDGAVISAPQITNATLQAVETALNNWLSGTVLGVGGGNLNGAFVTAVHIFSLNPLSVTVWSGEPGMTPRANWWVDA